LRAARCAGDFFFPTFISSCGVGFIRTSAPIVASNSDFSMTNPPHDDGPTDSSLIDAIRDEKPWSWHQRYHPSLRDHMHALGVVAANYNHLEQVFMALFWRYSSLDSTPALRLFQRLNNNRHRIDSLLEWIESKEFNTSAKELAVHFVKSFETCADNRNFLMHSLTKGTLEQTDKLVLAKAAKRDPDRTNSLQLGVEELRTVADDMFHLERFGLRLYVWWRARANGGKYRFSDGREFVPTLPEKSREPTKLTPISPQSQVDGCPPSFLAKINVASRKRSKTM
jgi:hypothetical protein